MGDRERRESSCGVELCGLRERSRREKTEGGVRPRLRLLWRSGIRLRRGYGPAWSAVWSSDGRSLVLGEALFLFASWELPWFEGL